MSTRIRPWVAYVAVGVILVSVLAVVSRRSGKVGTEEPENAGIAQTPASQTGGATGDVPARTSSGGKSADREPVRIAVPRKAKVILRDGKIVPAKEGRASLSDPGVMAVVYEGAPPAAVQRLKEILESGSNEYPDFTMSEKYPPWVYDKIREMLPGKLGEIIARMAREWSDRPPEESAGPYVPVALDYSNQEESGYATMRLISDQQKASLLSSPSHSEGTTLIAETRFGPVVVDSSPAGAQFTPMSLAVWLAHRLAAGDDRIKLPRIPPEGFDSWETWARAFIADDYARKLEDEGLLAKRPTR